MIAITLYCLLGYALIWWLPVTLISAIFFCAAKMAYQDEGWKGLAKILAIPPAVLLFFYIVGIGITMTKGCN